ncbi:MAG: ATP-binding protein [Terriglobales bacterium]
MAWRTEHTTGIVLLFALILPVAIYFAAYRAARSVASSLGWANHSQQVMLQLDHVQILMAAAEDSQSRYLLDLQPRFRARYLADIAQVHKALTQLDASTGDNQQQRRLLAALTTAVQDKQAQLDREMTMAAHGQAGAAFRDDSTGFALDQSLAVQDRAQASAAAEQKLLSERRGAARAFQRRWSRLFLGGVLVSALLLLGVFAMLVLQIRRRRDAQEALAASHRALKLSARRHESLISNVPAAVWTLRRDGSFEFISGHIEQLCGARPDVVLGAGSGFLRGRMAPEDATAMVAACARSFTTAVPLHLEFRLRHNDGRWVWLQALGQPDAAGAATLDGVFYDISEGKRRVALEQRQREIEIRAEEAQRAVQMKSDVLASVSHELRTPLSAILGFSDLLLQGIAGPLNPSQLGFAGHIQSGGEHLLALINDILDLSRMEAGRLPFHPAAVPLETAVNETMEMMDSLAAEKSIRLEHHPADGVTAWADPLRLRQIITNLLSNAIKFTPPDGRVSVRTEVSGEGVSIEVSDTGIGMAPEHLEAIFERFQQVSSDGAKPGSGLGLAITKQLVERQGGSISVTSTLGQGTVFRVCLPAATSGDAIAVAG